jgi:hypothetical protein
MVRDMGQIGLEFRISELKPQLKTGCFKKLKSAQYSYWNFGINIHVIYISDKFQR